MDQLSDLPTAILLLSPGLGDMAVVCLLGNRRVLPDFSLPQALSRPTEPAPPCWGPGDTADAAAGMSLEAEPWGLDEEQTSHPLGTVLFTVDVADQSWLSGPTPPAPAGLPSQHCLPACPCQSGEMTRQLKPLLSPLV